MNIREKCEQYWNEHNIPDAEMHTILEWIHRETYKEFPMALPENLKVLAQIMERADKLNTTDLNYLIDLIREKIDKRA